MSIPFIRSSRSVPRHAAFVRLAAFAALSLLPSAARAQLGPMFDSAARDLRRVRASQNPVGLPLRDALNRDARAMGLGASETFTLLRSHADARGTHARLQQRHLGLPIRGAVVIAHQGLGGPVTYTDASVRGITTTSQPAVSASQAIVFAEHDVRHLGAFVAAPTTELMYVPHEEQVLANGSAPPAAIYDPGVPYAMVESVNADDVRRRLVSTSLAWQVTGVERSSFTGELVAKAFWVDALTGRVFEARVLEDAVTGAGTGRWSGAVTFQTVASGSCFRMQDTLRQFTTETDDFGSSHAVNCDNNNQWGNGLAFAGNATASTANWQTAMVDGHFGATVYWDMMSNVFGYQGPDDDFYSVNVFMHEGTNYDDAHYNSLSGNVSFGDGSNGANRTQLDCLGHELGHAWNDHNTGYPTSFALNESLADIFGEFTDAYRASNFAAHGTSLGSNVNTDWVNTCSGRNLVNPSANGNPSYWYTAILDEEEHEGSAPASRAFAFLARGASAFMYQNNYSRSLPWGMNGIGLQSAARIFVLAHASFIAHDDYSSLRKGMIDAATVIFGAGSVEQIATRDAYAAINVGSSGSGLAAPTTVVESEPNSIPAAAQLIGMGMAPPPGAVAGAPRKVTILGTGGDDFYRVRVAGNLLSIVLTPTPFAGSFVVDIRNTNASVIVTGSASSAPQLLNYPFFNNPGHEVDYLIRVRQTTGMTANYRLDLDMGS